MLSKESDDRKFVEIMLLIILVKARKASEDRYIYNSDAAGYIERQKRIHLAVYNEKKYPEKEQKTSEKRFS